MYRFWPGCRPPYRQMFYQLCDVDLEEVQERAHRNDGKVIYTSLSNTHFSSTFAGLVISLGHQLASLLLCKHVTFVACS